MSMSSKDFTGSPGHVREMKWTPDGCAVRIQKINLRIDLISFYFR